MKAAIGRELTSENFYQTFDDWSSFDQQSQQQQQQRHHNTFSSSSSNKNNVSPSEGGCSSSPAEDQIDGRKAAHFDRQANGSIVVKINKELQKDFEISLQIRTFDQDGMLFAAMVRMHGCDKITRSWPFSTDYENPSMLSE